jgi:hypothetical protein
VRRWLHYTPDEWNGLPWDLQQMYLDGLSADPECPLQMQEDAAAAWQPGREAAPGVSGPQIRQAAAGAEVIDLRKMISELEADPQARRRT